MPWIVGPINRRVISDDQGEWVATCVSEEVAIRIVNMQANFELCIAQFEQRLLNGDTSKGEPVGFMTATSKTPEDRSADVNEALAKCADASKALDSAFETKPVTVTINTPGAVFTPNGWVNHL